MKLNEVINEYVTLQQSLGMHFKSSGRLLQQFGRAMGDIQIDQVKPQAVRYFVCGTASPTTWPGRYGTLSGLYRFAVGRGYARTSPLPRELPKRPPQPPPHIYSTEELRRLIDATSIVHGPRSQLRAPMCRTLLILLYGSGLRIGEALKLTLRDADVVRRIITVRDTKFYKTRLVPIGPKLARELAVHIARRRQLPMPAGEDSALFATCTGRGWSHRHASALFQQLRDAAQIGCQFGEYRRPRLHDLRHTAAVHRVLEWYRSGRDVQRLLPQLATYLGHIDIKSTQLYLQMTPELLEEAGRRFADYSQLGGGHE
jgi:integrase/recombinase XerD